MNKSVFDLKVCPICGFNLYDGDVYDVLRSLKEYEKYSDEEVEKIAESYGWKEDDKKHFSKLIGIELKYQCPECKNFVT